MAKIDSTTHISNLPLPILLEIILKLSTKSIVLCKFVCKTWHNLGLDPQFAKLHLTQSKPCLLIRNLPWKCIARALLMFDNLTCRLVLCRYSTGQDAMFWPETKSFLDSGALLMFDNLTRRLIFCDQSGGMRFKQVSSHDDEEGFEVIAHTPSFVSLKDILVTGSIEVFNVKSRCGKIKLAEEAYPVILN